MPERMADASECGMWRENIVRDITVSEIDTTANAANCHPTPSPTKAAKAAANAPRPNQNSTKPSVKISAIISPTATTSHNIHATLSIRPNIHENGSGCAVFAYEIAITRATLKTVLGWRNW